jgi:hypothetical protein
VKRRRRHGADGAIDGAAVSPSGDDVARELGLRPDHVATLLYRAKKELFRCVTGTGPAHR